MFNWLFKGMSDSERQYHIAIHAVSFMVLITLWMMS